MASKWFKKTWIGTGSFDFMDDRYLFNRGHWKFIEGMETNSSLSPLNVYSWEQRHEL